MKEPASGRIFYGWVVLAACFTISIVSGSFFYGRGVFLPAMSGDFGDSRFGIAVAFSIAQAVGALCAPLIGRALDRWSARWVLLAGAALVTAGYILTSLASGIFVLYLVFGFFFGVGAISISSFTTSKIVVRWFRRRRGLALSLDVAGASVAGILVPPIAAWLLLNHGWRGGYVVFGVLTALILVPVVTLLIRDPGETGDVIDGIRDEGDPVDGAAPDDPIERTWNTRELLASRSFWGILVVFSGMGCVWGGVNLHLFGHLEDSGMGAYEAALILSVMGTLIVSGKPLLGWMADALGAKLSIAISLVSQIVGVILFSLAQDQPAFLVAAVCYGFGLSGMAPLRSMALASAFGGRSYGFANGLLQPFSLPIVLLASPIAGFVYDELGSYVLAFQIFVAILLLTAPMLYFIRSGRGTASESPVAA